MITAGLDRSVDEDRARAAHLLRRTSLVVDRGRVERLAGLDHDEAVAEILTRIGHEPTVHHRDISKASLIG